MMSGFPLLNDFEQLRILLLIVQHISLRLVTVFNMVAASALSQTSFTA